MNTDRQSGPTALRTSMSAWRRPVSGRPIGMSIAMTDSGPLRPASSTRSPISAAAWALSAPSDSAIPIHPYLHASIPSTRQFLTMVSIGWQGAGNYHDTAAPLTVVLRSWEERFEATVMHVGFDTVDLLVERPPPCQQAALAVAAEHFAFCLDNICQEAGSISQYARELTGATRWSFWWD